MSIPWFNTAQELFQHVVHCHFFDYFEVSCLARSSRVLTIAPEHSDTTHNRTSRTVHSCAESLLQWPFRPLLWSDGPRLVPFHGTPFSWRAHTEMLPNELLLERQQQQSLNGRSGNLQYKTHTASAASSLCVWPVSAEWLGPPPGNLPLGP